MDFVDSQISVADRRFWSDVRWLGAWPLILPLTVQLCLDPSSNLAGGLWIAALALEAPWLFFLFRRRAAKKARWIAPQRFSDNDGGYREI